MKKKIYFQSSVSYQLFCFLILLISIFPLSYSLYMIVKTIIECNKLNFDIIVNRFAFSFLFMLVGLILLYIFIVYERNCIYLGKNTIYMKTDMFSKKKKIQFYTEINYIDISKIDIVYSNKRSNGEKTNEHCLNGGKAKMPYLCFTDINGDSKYMFIMFMSKKGLYNLIEDIRKRMLISGNISIIEDTQDILKKYKR